MSNEMLPSPFYEDIIDDKRREEAKLHAREAYDQYSRLRAEAFHGHVEYGKWLTALLLAAHGAAIFLLAGLKGSVTDEQFNGLLNCVAWNMAGVVFTLVCGCAAWMSFQFAHRYYMAGLNPAVLYRNDMDPPDNGSWAVRWTMRAAVGLGLSSILCFLVSAVILILVLKTG